MGKIIRSIAIVGLALILTGCGDNTVEKPIEQDKTVIDESSKNTEEKVETPLKEEELPQEKLTEEKVESKKEEYIQKLDDIEYGLSDLNDLYAGTTIDMKEASAEEHKRWDNALNEIYSVLEIELLSSDMDELRGKQIEWLDYRDTTAKTESLKFEGGTMEGLEYTQVLGKLTKERCYELVRIYMK